MKRTRIRSVGYVAVQYEIKQPVAGFSQLTNPNIQLGQLMRKKIEEMKNLSLLFSFLHTKKIIIQQYIELELQSEQQFYFIRTTSVVLPRREKNYLYIAIVFYLLAPKLKIMGESKRVYTIQFYRFYTQSILHPTQKVKSQK